MEGDCFELYPTFLHIIAVKDLIKINITQKIISQLKISKVVWKTYEHIKTDNIKIRVRTTMKKVNMEKDSTAKGIIIMITM